MLSIAALLGACAVLSLPNRRGLRLARSRFAAVHESAVRLARRAASNPALPALGGAVPIAAFGMPFAAAAFVVTVTIAMRAWHSARRTGFRTRAAQRFADALHAMVTELRRGAHPALAAASVGEVAEVGPVFAGVADAAGIGARVEDVLTARADQLPHLAPELRRLAAAWRLSNTHGLSLAELLEALHRDVQHRVRAERDARAELSGARASGWILAGLPIAGLLLGQLIGADPLGVLLGSGLGGVLLLLGTGLTGAGLLWTVRLTERAVPA